jgi:hypothetical protein
MKPNGCCADWSSTKHACWLSMVELESGVLARQCLDRRIDTYTPRRRDRRIAEAAQGGLKFPQRGIAQTTDGIARDTGPGLAPMAHDLQPAITTVEALGDGRRRLGWPAEALHLFRP